MNDDMNNNICDEVSNELLRLNPTDSLSQEVNEHLLECANCKAIYQDLLTIEQSIESMPEHDVSDQVFAQTLKTVQATKSVNTTVKKAKGINPQWATGLAASFVLVAVTGLIYNGTISEFQADFNQIPLPSEPEPIGQDSVAADGLRWRDSAGKDERSNIQLKEDDVSGETMVLEQLPQVVAAPKPTFSGALDEITSDAAFGLEIGNSNESDKITVTGSRRMLSESKKELREELNDQGPLMSLDQLEEHVSRVASVTDISGSQKQVQSNNQPTEDTESIQEPIERSNPVRPFDQRSNSEIKSLEERLVLKEQIKAKVAKRRNEMKENAQLAKRKEEPVAEPELKAASASGEQTRQDQLGDDLVIGVEDKESGSFSGINGGMVGRSAAVDNAAVKYLTSLQTTENLKFKSATGYWANTYLPGDPNMRWIQAELKQNDGLELPNVQQNVQPFDYPKNAALGLFLNADHKALNEAEPTRMRLQVGIQAGQQKGGHRSALNLAVVLDLGAQQETSNWQGETKALLRALLKNKQPGDQITVYTTGVGQLLSAEDFKHGPIQVALDKLFNQAVVANTPAQSLQQTLKGANTWLKTEDDPKAVLGSSAVLLISANHDLAVSSTIESMVQQNAIDGITLSTVSLAGIEHRKQLERLALMGQGHSRILAGVQDADRLIKQEFLVSSRAVARALRLQIKLAEGVQLIDVLGSYSLNEVQAQQVREAEQSLDHRISKNLGIVADRGKDDDGIQIVIPSYFAGDTHVILLDVLVKKSGPVAAVSAKYKDLIYLRNATVQKNLHMSTGQNNLGPLQLNVMKNRLTHHLSQSVTQASQAIRSGDQVTAVQKLTRIVELYQAMRQHIPAWANDAEMIQDEMNIKQYLQLLNGQSSINPKQYQLIANSMSFMSWRKLISHSP